MVQYHLMFKEIEQETLIAVREIIKEGLFKQDKSVEDKKILIQKLNDKLCNIYQLPIIPILYEENCFGVGRYNSQQDIILLNKTSLVTFLHECFHRKASIKKEENTEELARGWSHSVYFKATPILFANAVNKGLLIWQKSMEK